MKKNIALLLVALMALSIFAQGAAEETKVEKQNLVVYSAASEGEAEKLTEELGENPSEFTIDSWYYADGNEHEGQKYNVHCESYVKGYGMLEWYLMMEEDDGKWIEKGTSLRVDPSEE